MNFAKGLAGLAFLTWTLSAFGRNVSLEDDLFIFSATLKNLEALNRPPLCSKDAFYSPCDTIWNLTLQSGSSEDGTGKVFSDAESGAALKLSSGKLQELYAKKIRRMLEDPSREFDLARELALSSTREKNASDCVSRSAAEKKTCYERVSKKIAGFIVSGQFGTTQQYSADEYNAYHPFFELDSVIKSFEGIEDESVRLLNPDYFDKVKNEIFPKVVNLIADRVQSAVKDPKLKESVVKKIKSITFSMNCPLSDVGAHYDHRKHAMVFCPGLLLKSDSAITAAAIIAHEVSHSIDPCHIEMSTDFKYRESDSLVDLEKQYPFDGVASCLRLKESVGAGYTYVYKKGETANWWYGPPMPNHFCNNDQLLEGFSDWMTGEVLPKFVENNFPGLSSDQKIRAYSNVFRISAAAHGTGASSTHPATQDRLNRLIMVNPEIRRQLGCGPITDKRQYCEVGKIPEGTRVADPTQIYVPQEQFKIQAPVKPKEN